MSVGGIDFGNESMLIALAGKGGVDVILNGASNRQTATFVSIQGKNRFMGDAAASMARTNITNTFSTIKLLVGRKFDSPDVQKELLALPFKTVKLQHGGIGVVINYDGNDTIVPVEHLFAMLLNEAKDISRKANNGVNLADAVLAVPNWFTDSQRRGLLIASEIAGLNTLKVVNELTAIALSYGIFKSAKGLFSESEATHTMFIDIGLTGYSLVIVDFIKEHMYVKSSICERDVGGRYFDEVIISYLIEVFKTKTGIDVSKNLKALLKLRAAAEKAKKTLSPAGVSETNISVECLAEDRDLQCTLTRDEFETRSAHIFNRLSVPIKEVLAEAKLEAKDIHEVEIVGGSTRISMIKKVLGETLGLDATAVNFGLKTTMNADEAVARGAALQAAILSSRMKVKPFTIVDKLSYGVIVHFDNNSASSSDAEEDEEGKVDSVDIKPASSSCQLYNRGDEFPHKPRRITFKNKTSDFSVRLSYDELSAKYLPKGEDREIGTFSLKIPAKLVESGPKDVRVTFNIDKHGVVFIQACELMEGFIEEAKQNEDGTQTAPKKMFRKHEIEVVSNVFGLSREQIKASIELEAIWENEDRLIRETANKRNELESYIYSMRTKLESSLKSYSTSSERDSLNKLLNEAEDWLYGDGFESTKQNYSRKIDDLKIIGDKIEFRHSDEQNRKPAIDSLKQQIDIGKNFIANLSNTAEYDHITDEERTKVRDLVNEAESWLYDYQSKQSDLAQYLDPVLTTSMLQKKRADLQTAVNPILMKPRPKPAPEEKKEEETKGESESKQNEPMDTA